MSMIGGSGFSFSSYNSNIALPTLNPRHPVRTWTLNEFMSAGVSPTRSASSIVSSNSLMFTFYVIKKFINQELFDLSFFD